MNPRTKNRRFLLRTVGAGLAIAGATACTSQVNGIVAAPMDGGDEASTGPCARQACGSVGVPVDGSTGVLPAMIDGGDGGDGGDETDSGQVHGTVPIPPDGG
jgi:hypothetical protein